MPQDADDEGSGRRRKILGIEFFQGTAQQAIRTMRSGGLLVVPAAPALKDMAREAIVINEACHADAAATLRRLARAKQP